jgi:hypothetical protein
MTKKIKTDVRFKSTAQLEKQVALELHIPDPNKPVVFQNANYKSLYDKQKEDEEKENDNENP